jgi:hypothetical protein
MVRNDRTRTGRLPSCAKPRDPVPLSITSGGHGIIRHHALCRKHCLALEVRLYFRGIGLCRPLRALRPVAVLVSWALPRATLVCPHRAAPQQEISSERRHESGLSPMAMSGRHLCRAEAATPAARCKFSRTPPHSDLEATLGPMLIYHGFLPKAWFSSQPTRDVRLA